MAATGNVGVGCRASQVVGLDLDQHAEADGIASFTAICAASRVSWPVTFTVRTPNGGLHLYFRAPQAQVIGSVSGGRSGLGAGIDTRGPGRRSGGYLIGPGSVVNGRPYTIELDAGISGLPAWLADLI